MQKIENNEALTIPSELSAAVRAMADEEHRAPEEILREAVEKYLRQKHWQHIFAYGEARARELGLNEADIPRLIAEYRRDKR